MKGKFDGSFITFELLVAYVYRSLYTAVIFESIICMTLMIMINARLKSSYICSLMVNHSLFFSSKQEPF